MIDLVSLSSGCSLRMHDDGSVDARGGSELERIRLFLFAFSETVGYMYLYIQILLFQPTGFCRINMTNAQ